MLIQKAWLVSCKGRFFYKLMELFIEIKATANYTHNADVKIIADLSQSNHHNILYNKTIAHRQLKKGFVNQWDYSGGSVFSEQLCWLLVLLGSSFFCLDVDVPDISSSSSSSSSSSNNLRANLTA